MKWSRNSLLLIIILFYSIIRLPFLLQIPLFEDEAVYFGWSIEMIKHWQKISLPMSTGVSPLFSWLTALLLLIIKNPFVSGRLVSFISGAVTVIWVYKILIKRINYKLVVIFTLIFSCLPVMVTYDRLALLDSLMVCFVMGAIFYSEKNLYWFSTTALLAMLTKIIGIILIPAVLMAQVITYGFNKKFINLFIFSVLPVIIFGLVFLPFKNITTSYYSDYLFSGDNWSQIFAHIKQSYYLIYHWTRAYYSWPLAAGFVLGSGFSVKDKSLRFYSLVFLGFFILIPLIAGRLFPRYILILAPLMVIISAMGINFLYKHSKLISLGMSFLIFLSIGFKTYQLLKNPEKAQVLAREDQFQFYEDWTSGKILPQVADYFDNQVNSLNNIIIWTDETGLYYYGLPLYLKNNSQIIFRRQPQTVEELNNLVEQQTGSQFFIANRIYPEGIKFLESKTFSVSSRHEIKILRIK